jgi:hypothetical protein
MVTVCMEREISVGKTERDGGGGGKIGIFCSRRNHWPYPT